MTRFLPKGWLSLFFFVFLLLIWEFSTRYFAIEPYTLPAPTQIWDVLLLKIQDNLGEQIWETARVALWGWGWSIGVGLLIGLVLHLVPFLRDMFYPLLVISQNIPMIALAPLLVIWFGFSDLPKILVVILICFFPITVSFMDGLTQTDRTLRRYLAMSGASKWQVLTKLELPSAIPSLFSGLKISATYSVTGAVVAEWLGAQKGLGLMMTIASSSFKTDLVFVALFFIVLLSLVFFGVVVLCEHFVLKRFQKEVRR